MFGYWFNIQFFKQIAWEPIKRSFIKQSIASYYPKFWGSVSISPRVTCSSLGRTESSPFAFSRNECCGRSLASHDIDGDDMSSDGFVSLITEKKDLDLNHQIYYHHYKCTMLWLKQGQRTPSKTDSINTGEERHGTISGPWALGPHKEQVTSNK